MTKPAHARKIAVLLQSLEGGGSQRRVVDLVNGFMDHGREVDLLLPQAGGALRERLAAKVRVIDLGKQQPGPTLADHLDRERPDVLLAGAAAVHPIAVDATRRSGHSVPLVLRASSHPFRFIPWALPRQRLTEYARRPLRLRRYAAADLIIAVSNDIAQTLKSVLPRANVVTVPNAVITDAFLAGADAPVDWPGESDRPTIVSIGRFAMAKDFPTLLRAFALVRKRQRARLVVIGGGSAAEGRALKTLASRLGTTQDVAFVGESDTVAAWLGRAHLFVSSSLWEGSPAALIEALAMGCPVVATDSVGSSRELLSDSRLGRLVPPREPRAMAEAIVAELGTKRDPAVLKAAVAAYGSGDRAADYLAAIDSCVSAFSPPSQ